METLREFLHPAMTLLGAIAVLTIAYALLRNLCTKCENIDDKQL